MGICASCLGLDRNREVFEEDEQARLIFEESHANNYGSFGEQNSGVIQADPQEVQRENEALQKVVMQTSDHLVDIFAMVPQNAPRASGTTFTGQDTRLLRYQDILAKMPTHAPVEASPHFSGGSNPSDGWLSEDEELDEAKSYGPVKSEDVGRLLGGFEDAESAME
ncbi:hypothetical protein PVAG01_05963 [Phlyctema vagabunda]|uniref:Late endosomal/lysosomal adaptor and MAPK and MTOR activator 1 n=1 Tax=Phlyctema vagabunda TaxID=108571 RepID=A0ABR4PFD0_9HELO